MTRTIQLDIHAIKNLPVLPEASVRILQAINDPEIEVNQLVEVLSTSPGLLARLLGLANSAFFGQSRQIEDLHTAIVRVLGLQLVKNLVMGILLNVQLNVQQLKHFDTRFFWQFCLLTAQASQKLMSTAETTTFSPAQAYTSGLLLNIGLLVVAYLFPKEWDELLCHSDNHWFNLEADIQQHFGCSHYEMGYVLLKKWQVSDTYQQVLRGFADKTAAETGDERFACLRMAQGLSALVLANDTDPGRLVDLCLATGLSIQRVTPVFAECLADQERIAALAVELVSL